jgi:putative transposase
MEEIMPRKRFSDSQISLVVKELESGASVTELSRKLGVSEATLYNWKAKYRGMEAPDMRKLRQLEQENAKLKKVVADLTLDKVMLQDVLSKKL